MCVHLTSGSPAQRPIWTGFVLPTPIFTSHRAPIHVNATYSPLHREGSQEEKSKCAKTIAGKKTHSATPVSRKHLIQLERSRSFLSPRKTLPLPCTSLQLAGTRLPVTCLHPEGGEHDGGQPPTIHTSHTCGWPSSHPLLPSLFPPKFTPRRRAHAKGPARAGDGYRAAAPCRDEGSSLMLGSPIHPQVCTPPPPPAPALAQENLLP